MTVWDCTGDDVRTGGGRVDGVIFIDSLLTVIDHIEGFPGRDVRLPVDIVFQQRWLKAAVILGVGNAVDIPSSFAFLGDNWFAGFWSLAGQRVLGNVLQQASMENRMDLHRLREVKFDDQWVGEHSFDWKGSHMAIV